MKIIGIIANKKLEENKVIFRELIKYLKKIKKNAIFDKNSYKAANCKKFYSKADILKKAHAVITLGGDGTVLKTARLTPKRRIVPIITLNLGTLGFLTEFDKKNLFSNLNRIFLEKSFIIDYRRLLRVTVYREGKKEFTTIALNEAVINQGNFARLITLRTEVERRKVSIIKADGLIIATPTGSTAHSLSANGPIIHPQIEGILITPICPTGFSYRPIVIPNDKQIRVILETERRNEDASDIGLTVDGQIIFPLKHGDIIKIRKSHRTFPILRMKDYWYYKSLRNKLGWAG
ncbi:MAG: putative inorganic polyphosphate/ATP-NAD kinase [Candidatus Peregrinibacteria bacterium GW2011_GWA2_33_10]|nr:MAG: putative inorganic polyphosphate/ATP-NAD kinase [Candidatus Peregrinibacteria bacterium GW2011_GWA2_33_10]KKP41084.1 MAG: ATP-NAD/AcoX kinase, NAD+ kinase [Candidatus Peregrinibacteria bacterium GW2011_GWC2_33_13]